MSVTALRLSGIGDEAGSALEQQIAVHRELGWHELELRTVGGSLVQDLPEQELERLSRMLRDAAIGVPVICSTVGNWDSRVSGPVDRDLRQLDGALRGARILGARMIRVMSFPDDGLPAEPWRSAVLERMSTLAARAHPAGVTLAVENCSGWAADDPERAVALIAASPTPLRILFDTGNPVAYGYDGLAYLRAVLPWVSHVHVKDARGGADESQTEYVHAGAGDARLAEIIRLLVRSGYRGGVSIEPEVRRVFHRGVTADDSALRASYLQYARRFERMLERTLPGAHVRYGAIALAEAAA